MTLVTSLLLLNITDVASKALYKLAANESEEEKEKAIDTIQTMKKAVFTTLVADLEDMYEEDEHLVKHIEKLVHYSDKHQEYSPEQMKDMFKDLEASEAALTRKEGNNE